MGYRGLQTAGVPGFPRICRGNAGLPSLFDALVLSVSARRFGLLFISNGLVINWQLVSLAQAGNEITQDSLKRDGCY
jgi:hypothetical protein